MNYTRALSPSNRPGWGWGTEVIGGSEWHQDVRENVQETKGGRHQPVDGGSTLCSDFIDRRSESEGDTMVRGEAPLPPPRVSR